MVANGNGRDEKDLSPADKLDQLRGEAVLAKTRLDAYVKVRDDLTRLIDGENQRLRAIKAEVALARVDAPARPGAGVRSSDAPVEIVKET